MMFEGQISGCMGSVYVAFKVEELIHQKIVVIDGQRTNLENGTLISTPLNS